MTGAARARSRLEGAAMKTISRPVVMIALLALLGGAGSAIALSIGYDLTCPHFQYHTQS